MRTAIPAVETGAPAWNARRDLPVQVLMTVNLLVLVGSQRAGSVNRLLADRAIAQLDDDVTTTVWEALADLPHYSQDLDGDTVPESVAAFRAAVEAADGLLLVTPEYNGSIPSLLKNAIDWASRPRGASSIAGKPAAVLGASLSPRNALWAREHAVRVLTIAGAKPLETTVGFQGDGYDEAAVGALLDELVTTASADEVAA